MPKLDNYNVGGGGVNLVKDPLQLADSELSQAQNAEWIPDSTKGGEGALSKRGGLAVLTSGLAGTLLGIIGLPLNTTYTRTLYFGLGAKDTDTWLTTTDGTTFTTVTAPRIAAKWYQKFQSALTGQSSLNFCNRRAVSFKTLGMYGGDNFTIDSTNPVVEMWNGTDNVELFRIPIGPESDGTNPIAITDMLQANNKVYLAIAERASGGSFHGGRILSYDPITGQVKQVANAIGLGSGEVSGGNPTCLAWYQGQLWVGQHATNSGAADVGKVIRCYPDIDTAWTVDVSNLDGKPNSLCVFKGNLYTATSTSDGTGTITKRAASSATWSNVDTFSQANYTHLIEYNSTLFACRYVDDATDKLDIMASTDGSTWASSRDVYTNDSSSSLRHCLGAIVFNGLLFYGFQTSASDDLGTSGFIMKYNGSAWTKISTDGNMNGPFFTLLQRT